MNDQHGKYGKKPISPMPLCNCRERQRGRLGRLLMLLVSRQFWKRALMASLYAAGVVAIINDLIIIVGRTLAPTFFSGANTVILEKIFDNFSAFLGG